MINPELQSVIETPFRDFLTQNSNNKTQIDYFNAPSQVYLSSTEPLYPVTLDKISVKGGLHLAVGGGLDPALGQIGRAKPNLTILCEINPFAVPVIYMRLALTGPSNDGLEYWQYVKEAHGQGRMGTGLPLLVSAYEASLGWSSPEYFQTVKDAWSRGTIKLMKGDITDDGVRVGMEVARKTSTPIRLIYLSNIFDYPQNIEKTEKFKESLNKGIQEGVIDPEAQVVEASFEGNASGEVYSIRDYLDRDVTKLDTLWNKISPFLEP